MKIGPSARHRLVNSALLSSGIAIAVATTATCAQAQTAPGTAVATRPAAEVSPITEGDIVVTARKRDESLVTVPVAVSALGKADIERTSTTDLTKVGQLVPQVIIVSQGGGGSGGSLSIRGIGTSGLDAGIEQAVSVNLDGLQVTRGRVAGAAFFDVQQVEVLKGPQALFFGKNSPAGVISVTSAGPTKHWEGYAKAGYEFNAKERYFEGAVGGPLTDTLGVRFAVRASQMDGYIKNVAQPMANPIQPQFPLPGANRLWGPDARQYAGRATIAWTPTDQFQATLKLFGSDYRDHTGRTEEVVCPSGVPTTFGFPDPTGDCSLNGVRSVSGLGVGRGVNSPNVGDGQPYMHVRSELATLTMKYDTDVASITSVSSGYYSKSADVYNVDYTSLGQVIAFTGDDYHQYSQEIRVLSKIDGPINFLIGGYYEHTRYFNETDSFFGTLGADPRNGKYERYERPGTLNGTTYSAFGQVIWDITPKLQLTAGARWTAEKKNLVIENSFLNSLDKSGAFAPEGVIIRPKPFRDDNTSPEVTLSWHPVPHSTLYASYRTGYASGGFSIPSALTSIYSASPNALGFNSETAKGGEIGAKGSFFGQKLFVNAALYRYTYAGLQLSSFNANPPSFTVGNAASARSTGAELELQYRASRALSLHGSVGYARSRYQSFKTSACYAGQTAAQGCVAAVQDLTGAPLVRAPEWSILSGATYETPISSDLVVSFSGDMKYSSGYFTQENENPVSYQKGFILVNSSVRLHTANDKWELALIGRNLTNKHYGLVSGDKTAGSPGQIADQAARPREIILQATARF